MAVQIPTLIELFNSIKGDLEGKLGITIPFFGKAFLNGLAGVQAAKIKLIYLAIANLQKNVFPDLAESEALGGTLERFGRVKLNRNPFPAVAGQYTVNVTGQIGATINANTTFKSNDSSSNPSKLFILDSAFTFVGTTGVITIRATEGGLNSRLEVGNTLTATAPILNAEEIVTVATESIQPLAAEDLEVYRAKIIEAFRLEPEGGAGSDYRLWSADAQGVKKVYPYAKTGVSNEINLFVESTIANSSDSKGTPPALMITDVENVVEFDPDTTAPLNERGRRPLGVFAVNVLPVTIKEIDVTITGFQGSTPAIVASILAAITDGVSLVRPFVSSADILIDKNDILNESKLIFLLLSANQSIFTSLTFTVDGVATSSVTFTNGDIPFLNSITYV
jgi:hypothetical protein